VIGFRSVVAANVAGRAVTANRLTSASSITPGPPHPASNFQLPSTLKVLRSRLVVSCSTLYALPFLQRLCIYAERLPWQGRLSELRT